MRGIIYPLTIDSRGNLVVAEDAELYSGLILSVLETEPGENPLRPLYGTPGILFSANQGLQAYASDVLRRLRDEIPQCEFSAISTLDDNGAALLEVFWSLGGNSQESIRVSI